jgi:hypothetical protein
MQAYDDRADKPTDLEDRTVRALTEYLTVLPEGGDVHTVVSQSGSSYRVDARDERCTCPDYKYNLDDDETCKHIRRVAYETGETPIPAWINPDELPDDFALHVDETPRVTATDGGVVATGDGDTDDGDDSGRPDNCQCWNPGGDLACWPCFREGFHRQNPDVTDDVNE